jgi:hypothetical protein
MAPNHFGEIGVEVVIHFKFCRRFVKQHPATAAEHLNVSVTGMAESCHDLVAQGFFAAYPCHKAVHWDPFRYVLHQKKVVLPLFCKTTYIFLLLEFTSPFDIA